MSASTSGTPDSTSGDNWIAITVYDHEKDPPLPLAGATVQLIDPSGATVPGDPVVTDAAGYARFANLTSAAAGFYQIQIVGYAAVPMLTRQSTGAMPDSADGSLGAGTSAGALPPEYDDLHKVGALLSPKDTLPRAAPAASVPATTTAAPATTTGATGNTTDAATSAPPLPIVALLADHQFQEIFCGDQGTTPNRYFSTPNHSTNKPAPAEIRVDQEPVIRAFAAEVAIVGKKREFWMVTVPSSGEAIAHHTAWDQRAGSAAPADPNDPGASVSHWVEPEYRARLRHAYLLLTAGVVRYVFISGGKIDPSKDWWMDALFGWQEMVDTYSTHWASLPTSITGDKDGNAQPLKARLIVDPWAIHSETNIRNGARLCAALGLERTLIATTYGGKVAQANWFTMGTISSWCEDFCCCIRCGNNKKESFTGKCIRKYGGKLGQLREFPRNISAGGFKLKGGCCGNETGIFGTAVFDFPGEKNPLYKLIPFSPRGPGASCSTYTTCVLLQWQIPQTLLLDNPGNAYDGWSAGTPGASGATGRWDHIDNVA